MFSREDIRLFRIKIELPEEENKSLVEKFILKYPLTTLKFESRSVLVGIRKLLDQLPKLSLSGHGINVTLSDALIVEIGEERASLMIGEELKEEEGEKVSKYFSNENLGKLNTDVNFVLAGVLGILKLESFKAEGTLRIQKKFDAPLQLDEHFTTEFTSKFNKFENLHFTGLEGTFSKKLFDKDASHRFRILCGKENLYGFEFLEFEITKALDFVTMIDDCLNELNLIYRITRGEA